MGISRVIYGANLAAHGSHFGCSSPQIRQVRAGVLKTCAFAERCNDRGRELIHLRGTTVSHWKRRDTNAFGPRKGILLNARKGGSWCKASKQQSSLAGPN